MTRKLTPMEKRARRPASRACVFCHSKHLQCGNERPCNNCVKRNLAHECHDVVRKRAKYLTTNNATKKPEARSQDTATPPTHQPTPPHPIVPRKPTSPLSSQFFGTNDGKLVMSPAPAMPVPSNLARQLQESFPAPPQNSMLDTTKDVINRLINEPQAPLDTEALELSVTPASTPNGPFSSNYLNQEYLMLGDILLQSKPMSPSNNNNLLMDFDFGGRMKDSRPFISLGFSNSDDTSSMVPAASSSTNLNHNLGLPPERMAPVPYTSPLITHHLYQTVPDIYSHNTMNFDYPQSYHSLTTFLKKRFSGNSLAPQDRQRKREHLLVILKLIASYRPTFISAHKNLLKPYDLQFLEMNFQRSLIDYEKLSQLNSSPTIMWRRTGEIVSITDDLLSLLGFDIAEILGKRTFIMELMYDDESIINYFKLFKSIAVGNLHSSIMTKLKLLKNTVGEDEPPHNLSGDAVTGLNKETYIEFCSVWTVKRDIFDIPMLIIGQFLPVLPTTNGIRMY
ncbi:glucose starvation modulator protein 1 [Diutina catenulata]